MKWFFILLLLVNILYLGWELDRETEISARDGASVSSIPSSARQLRLVSEMQAPPAPRPRQGEAGDDGPNGQAVPDMDLTTTEELMAELPEILPDDTDDIVSRDVCYRYGPIPDENMVKGLYDWFRSRDARARIRYTEDQASRMFWIYLAPRQSRESALAVIEEMQSKGIGDYRLIDRGDLENAISLGLYSSRDAVDDRLRELNEKGYVPVVVPYSDVKRIFWLDIKMSTALPVANELFGGFPARYESVPVNCNDISGL